MNHLTKTTACPLCSAKHPEINILPYPLFRHMDFSAFHPGPNRIGRCRICSLVFRMMDDEEQREIDNLYCSEEYIRHEEPHTLLIEGHSEPVSLAFVQARLLKSFVREKNPSVLDIGCFDGSLLSELGGIFAADCLCGFDVGPRPQFPSNGPFRFVCGQLEAVEGSFDLILMSHSIQYIRDIHSLFEKIRNLLKPEGQLFIQVPDFSVKPASLLLGDLYYHYTPVIIGNILRHMGFKFRFLNNNYFPRDILVIASPGGPEKDEFAALDDHLKNGLSHLVEVAKRLRKLVISEPVGVLGTTIDAAFVNQCLDSRVAFFTDENPRKVGKTFHGKPIVHPRSIGEKETVIIPMGVAGGESIRKRFTGQYKGSYVCV